MAITCVLRAVYDILIGWNGATTLTSMDYGNGANKLCCVLLAILAFPQEANFTVDHASKNGWTGLSRARARLALWDSLITSLRHPLERKRW